ncbi:unnamed protein product [Camellia sinensis]
MVGIVLGFTWVCGEFDAMERNEDAKHHDSEPPTPHSIIKMGSRLVQLLSSPAIKGQIVFQFAISGDMFW